MTPEQAQKEFEKTQAAVLGDLDSIEATVQRLSTLNPIEADIQVKTEAKRLGCTAGVLRKEVDKARGGEETTGSGQPFTIEEPEPWPYPVDGGRLLDDLAAIFSRHVILPDHGAEIAALWTLHTYTYDAGHISPILVIQSPEKGCGKTTFRDTLAAVVRSPLSTDGISASALFRVVEKWQPTLLLDDFDSWGKENDDLRGVLNTGYRRGGHYVRCSGDDNEPRTFSTYCPKCINLIGRLHATLYDRGVVVSLRRKLRGETVQSMHDLDGADIQSQCARWAADNSGNLRHHRPAMPEGLFNRQADNWFPLLALADIVGGDWPIKARAAAIASMTRDDDNESARVMLLADIRQIMDEQSVDLLYSAELSEALHKLEDRPWGDWKHGKGITPVQVARLLKDFKIRPGDRRSGGRVQKGYHREQFSESWERYLGEIPPQEGISSATPLQPASDKAFSHFQPATDSEGVADQKPLKPASHKDCSGVAGQNPQNGENGEISKWRASIQ